MSSWEILLDVIGWVLLGIVILFAVLVVWSIIAVMVKRLRSRSHTIFKSPDK